MFKLSTDPRFTHEVKVQVPVDGGFKEQSFKATFRVLPLDQLKADEEVDGDEAGYQETTLRKVVVGLDDLVDDADQPIAYSDEIRDRLIAVPYVRIALMQTYIRAVTKVKAGN